MKKQIRSGVFETNSSSVHSLTMCSADDYRKWENEDFLYWGCKEKFATKEEIIKELQNEKWYDGSLRYKNVNWDDEDEVNNIFNDEEIKTSEEFFDDDYFETFEQTYITPKGEEVVAFGYYGHD